MWLDCACTVVKGCATNRTFSVRTYDPIVHRTGHTEAPSLSLATIRFGYFTRVRRHAISLGPHDNM